MPNSCKTCSEGGGKLLFGCMESTGSNCTANTLTLSAALRHPARARIPSLRSILVSHCQNRKAHGHIPFVLQAGISDLAHEGPGVGVPDASHSSVRSGVPADTLWRYQSSLLLPWDPTCCTPALCSTTCSIFLRSFKDPSLQD